MSQYRLADWIVRPMIVPMLLVLLVAAALVYG
jgi:hypothetical protein